MKNKGMKNQEEVTGCWLLVAGYWALVLIFKNQ